MTQRGKEEKAQLEKLDPKKDGASPDVVADNIERLRDLFPEVFADGKLDFDALRETLGDYVDDRQERYSFTWHGKSRARRIAQTPSAGTLLPCPDESVDWDETKNLFIEGDNLEVLKLLQKSYHRRVKMIYIDPPYNTGKEFIYPDKYQDNLATYLKYTGQVDGEGFRLSSNPEGGGRFHTNWLNMMYPRLKLARNLLRDDGVIFVSIDDHEVQNLRLMMDEVFGPENFVATVIWHKVYVPKNSARHFSVDHDYILVYARLSERWAPELLPRTAKQDAKYTNPDNDPRGAWRAGPMAARNYYSKGSYPITCPGGRIIDGPPSGSYWRFSKERFDEMDRDGRIFWGADGNNSPATKLYLSEVKSGRVPQTIWSYKDVGHTQEAKKELLRLVEFASSDTVFDTPKPPRLVKQMLRIGTRPREGDIILDFFAGSGSTGDAVMQLNAEDDGNRRFLLVQLPELTGAEDFASIAEITKARLRAASNAVGSAMDDDELSELDLGFKAFRLSSSNIEAWDEGFGSLVPSLRHVVDNVKSDRGEEDVLFELLLKGGHDLAIGMESRTIAGCPISVIGGGALVVCLAAKINVDVAVGIVRLRDELKPEVFRVVFRDTGFPNDVVKTNVIQILMNADIKNVRSL